MSLIITAPSTGVGKTTVTIGLVPTWSTLAKARLQRRVAALS